MSNLLFWRKQQRQFFIIFHKTLIQWTVMVNKTSVDSSELSISFLQCSRHFLRRLRLEIWTKYRQQRSFNSLSTYKQFISVHWGVKNLDQERKYALLRAYKISFRSVVDTRAHLCGHKGGRLAFTDPDGYVSYTRQHKDLTCTYKRRCKHLSRPPLSSPN